ncbi:MAG: DUF4340 domain-containing protein [Spirochaetaceae bacterium]|jgi:hypothetical protein|nr:DUF4340 domain-containing protein [Spirochaetaceae bacterium]
MKGRIIWGASFLLLLVLGSFLFFSRPGKEEPAAAGGLLAAFGIGDVEEIQIKNRHDAFSLWQEEGGFILADLPMEEVNTEYLFLLLDESSRVEYLTLVSDGEEEGERTLYGFDDPEATVTIRYTDGSVLSLIFGAEEAVSRGRYVISGSGNQIYLMDRSRAVRFLQPLKNFINYEIVPSRAYPSPLEAIQYLRLSGKAFPRPIVISGVEEHSEEDMRIASSFGAASHLIRSPVLHEIDQKECIEVFSSLTGLLNIEVFDYNVSDEELATLGFDSPWVMAEYDYRRSKEEEALRIILRVVQHRDGYLLTRDEQRVVHRIENKAFIGTSYEKLALRWFLTPFITDLESIRIDLGQDTRIIRLSGKDNPSLKAVLDGKPLDIDLFRKFYRLLISASNDGVLLEQPLQEEPPLLGLTFVYRDGKKKDDTMVFTPGSLRRLNVTVNGVTEFSMLERYLRVTAAALEALAEGRDFSTDW